MADLLFGEIIINILYRLPTTALLRCTAVCKSWYSLITSLEFISSHLKFAVSRKKIAPLLLLRRCIMSSEHYDLYSDNESFSRHETFESPFSSMNSFFTIVGTCNGLMCLSDDQVYHMNTIVLWNPCIRKSVLLPKPNMIYNSHGSFTQCLGFGFDHVCNDYKVVRITYVDFPTQPQIEVYKLSSGVWHDRSELALEYTVCNRSRQVYVNGAAHWIAGCMEFYDLIVLFDMSSELFRTMMLPVRLVTNDPLRNHDLAVYRDSVALILWNVSEAEPRFCVWVMQEYGVGESWTKHLCFDLSSFGNGFVRPLWIREQGEVVVVRNDGHLVSYDRGGGGGGVKDLGVRGSRSSTYQRSLRADSYTSSLVLLDRGPFSDATATALLWK